MLSGRKVWVGWGARPLESFGASKCQRDRQRDVHGATREISQELPRPTPPPVTKGSAKNFQGVRRNEATAAPHGWRTSGKTRQMDVKPTLSQTWASQQREVRNMRSKCRCSCVLQFTFRRAVSCVLHRPPSQVIHCTVLCFFFFSHSAPVGHKRRNKTKRFQSLFTSLNRGGQQVEPKLRAEALTTDFNRFAALPCEKGREELHRARNKGRRRAKGAAEGPRHRRTRRLGQTLQTSSSPPAEEPHATRPRPGSTAATTEKIRVSQHCQFNGQTPTIQ